MQWSHPQHWQVKLNVFPPQNVHFSFGKEGLSRYCSCKNATASVCDGSLISATVEIFVKEDRPGQMTTQHRMTCCWLRQDKLPGMETRFWKGGVTVHLQPSERWFHSFAHELMVASIHAIKPGQKFLSVELLTKGRHEARMYMAPDCSGFQNAHGRKYNSGRSSGWEVVQVPYMIQIKHSTTGPPFCLLIAQALARAMTTPAILSSASWKCTSPLISSPATVHQTEVRALDCPISWMQQAEKQMGCLHESSYKTNNTSHSNQGNHCNRECYSRVLPNSNLHVPSRYFSWWGWGHVWTAKRTWDVFRIAH